MRFRLSEQFELSEHPAGTWCTAVFRYHTRANRVPGGTIFQTVAAGGGGGGGDTIQEGALFKRGLYYFNHPPSKANQMFSSFLTVPSILKSN